MSTLDLNARSADRLPILRGVAEPEVLSCSCGIVVIGTDELDELGLCVVCAGSGHDWGCACLECGIYLERTDAGEGPTLALEASRSAARTAGSGSR